MVNDLERASNIVMLMGFFPRKKRTQTFCSTELLVISSIHLKIASFFLLKKQYQKKSYFTFSSNYYISIFVGWGPYFDNLNSMFKTLIPLASLVQGGSSTQKILQIFHSIRKAFATLKNGSGWVFCSLTQAFSSFLTK